MHSSQSYRGTIHEPRSRSNVEKCIRIAAKKQVPRFLSTKFPEFGGATNLFENKFSSGFERGKSMERRASNEPGERSCYLSTIGTCLPPFFIFFFWLWFRNFISTLKEKNRSRYYSMIDTYFSRLFFTSSLIIIFIFTRYLAWKDFDRIGWICWTVIFFFYIELISIYF